MSIDTGITSSTGKVLVLTVWDVEVRLRVTVLLGQTEIDHVDLIATLADTHQEVVRLDVTMDEGLGMNVLNARYELIGQEQDSLQGKLAVAEVEQIFQARAEQIKDHGIVVTLGSKPTDEWDADASSKGLVDTSLIFELRVLGLNTLKFDGNLLARDDIGAWNGVSQASCSDVLRIHTEVNVTKTPTTDLSADTILVPHAEILRERCVSM
jgi:hypothetical protein